MFKIFPYKMASESAKKLAEALNCVRVKPEGKALKFKGTLINWGSSAIMRQIACDKVLNPPEAVKKASNKLETFSALTVNARINTPAWTNKKEEAQKWYDDGKIVVARTVLNGHSGQGLVLCHKDDEPLVDAPLYTLYIAKKHEYRLHVMNGEVFFVQRKARKKEVPDDQINWQVRNLNGGFIFAHQGIDVPDVAKEQAVMSVKALGLDFGAVDLIWNERQDRYYVLEVNTACGLEGTTLEKYCEAFGKYDVQR